jgi:hypothetical protein
MGVDVKGLYSDQFNLDESDVVVHDHLNEELKIIHCLNCVSESVKQDLSKEETLSPDDADHLPGLEELLSKFFFLNSL